MSSDGTRKQTRTWDAPSNGQTINLVDSDDVAIAEAPSGPVAAALAPGDQRPRKNTLERFNDEMSVLDRPLEGEVEYFDEAPPPSRLKGVALFMGIVAVVGLGGGFVMARRHAASAPVAAIPAQAPVAVTPAPEPAATAPVPPEPPKPEPTVLAAAAPAAAEAPAAPAVAEDDATDEDSVQPAPSSHGAWNKVKSKSGHAKHSRSSAKSAHGSSKHVAGKHGSSRHH
jgi:hypothetical protein